MTSPPLPSSTVPPRGPLGHLVVLHSGDEPTRAACARLVTRLRPMLARMSAAEMLESWWLGQAAETSPALRFGLRVASDSAAVLFVVLRDEVRLARYYDDAEHREVREWFYRGLPSVQDLWALHDRAPSGERGDLVRRIELAVGALLTRIDVNLEPGWHPSRGGAP
jgi:hypothetical protein